MVNKRTIMGMVLCMVLVLAGCRKNTAPAETAAAEAQSKLKVLNAETSTDTEKDTAADAFMETGAWPKI